MDLARPRTNPRRSVRLELRRKLRRQRHPRSLEQLLVPQAAPPRRHSASPEPRNRRSSNLLLHLASAPRLSRRRQRLRPTLLLLRCLDLPRPSPCLAVQRRRRRHLPEVRSVVLELRRQPEATLRRRSVRVVLERRPVRQQEVSRRLRRSLDSRRHRHLERRLPGLGESLAGVRLAVRP